MKTENIKFKTIDDYISTFPKAIQSTLNELRKLISSCAPKAEEKISYQMPTYYLNGNLVHFAGYKNHIGFYPTPSGIENFADELKDYKTSKGAVQFPIDKPLPKQLIKKIVKFRVEENLKKLKNNLTRK
ncbi:MAG: DUF1801 domain-containing protein [Ignavibacteriales bacterium]|nr:DUF1801 domain-containing protein [Ignavibacteriales bacterium]MCB9258352.1 DUF1801 domain-containing protein [Ignavibacteriales bacterium]